MVARTGSQPPAGRNKRDGAELPVRARTACHDAVRFLMLFFKPKGTQVITINKTVEHICDLADKLRKTDVSIFSPTHISIRLLPVDRDFIVSALQLLAAEIHKNEIEMTQSP